MLAAAGCSKKGICKQLVPGLPVWNPKVFVQSSVEELLVLENEMIMDGFLDRAPVRVHPKIHLYA
jgi:hypothetical protein